MGSGAGGNSVEQRKRRGGATGPTSGSASSRGDVFDQLGNAGILAQVGTHEAEAEGPSLLSLAEVDARDLGSSDEAKQTALGDEGKMAIDQAIEGASVALGAVGMDDAARDAVSHRVRDSLEVHEIVKARQEDRLDDLVQSALRDDAIRSRDEVVYLLQQLAQNERGISDVLAGGDPGTIAVRMIEHLAVEMGELQDLYALAAYDHADILETVVLGDQALAVHRRLSPLALRMGGFSAVAYQMVVDELARHPLPVDPTVDGSPGPVRTGDPRLVAFRGNLRALVTDLRLFRTASAE